MKVEIVTMINKGYAMRLLIEEIGIGTEVSYYSTWEDLLKALQEIYKTYFE